MSASSADRDPLDRLAEEFVSRLRAGQRPALSEYAQRYPELAEQIRDLFPALVEMEHLKPATGEHTGAFTPAAEPTDPVRVGEFRILRQVGRGGMGVVYEAVQESLGRHVALKLLPPEAVADPKRLERFRREASAAARLHHTNIVPVFGVGAAEGRHYYAMQFISGHPLDAVIDEVKRLKVPAREEPPASRDVSAVAAALVSGTFTRTARPGEPDADPAGDTTRTHRGGSAPGAVTPGAPADSAPALSGSISEGGRSYWGTVARIGAQVADALAYAHAQGVLHRDIKPANLLLDLRGTVWVTDFGLAKAADAAGADDLTRAGDIVGTLRYMAPERFEGAGDHRADVYALGLTLYELLTLEPAFAAPGQAQLVEQVLAAAPPAPRSRVPAIPRDLETIVLKAIARDPAMRYDSAGELAEDLRRFLEDRPIRARRASSAEQAFRWCRRNKAVAALLTAVLIVFAAGAAGAGFFAVRAEDQRARAEGREIEATDAKDRADEERNRANAAADKVLAEQQLTRRLLYISHMNHASVAVKDCRIAHALEILAETTPKPGEPDLRGWEWYYLDRLLRGESRVVRLDDPPTDANVARTVFFWSHQRDQPFPLCGNGSRVLGLRPDTEGYRFDVWDTTTGRLINRFPPTGQPVLLGGQAWSLIPIFSPDGSQLGVWEQGESGSRFPPVNSPGRLRIWKVDTGQELPAPDIGPSVLRSVQTTVYPPLISLEAGGVRWLERSPRPPVRGADVPKEPNEMGEKPGGAGEPGGGSPQKTEPNRLPWCNARYWDRATGQTTSHQCEPRGGFVGKSQDGRIVLFRLDLPDPLKRPVGARDGETFPLECWDVAAAPPRRVWTASAPAWSASAGGQGSIRISPGGKMVAVSDDTGVTVYRTEDRAGEPVIEWRAELPEENKDARQALRAVFDDGRLVMQRRDAVPLLAPDRQVQLSSLPRSGPRPVVTRQTVLYTPRVNWRGALQLTDDGKTLVGVEDAHTVRIWHLDRTVAPTRGGRRVVAATSPDGRLIVEKILAERPDGLTGHFGDSNGGEILVKDTVTQAVRLRIAVPVGTPQAFAFFAAGSQRLLVQFRIQSSATAPGSIGSETVTWELYDTVSWHSVTSGKWKQVTGPFLGRYLFLSPGGRWFVEGSVGDRELIVRDALTGRVTREVCVHEGTVVGAYQFDPTADRLAVVTVPTRVGTASARTPEPISGPFDLWLFDLAAERHRWTRPAVDECAVLPNSVGIMSDPLFKLVFSPNGRLLVGFRHASGAFRVWVGRSENGADERTLTVAADPETKPHQVTTQANRVSLDRDGRRVAVIGGGEVRVWDLEDGRLVATVRGHDSLVSAVALSPDGTRLFTLPVAETLPERVNVRVGVWDLETARLVFTVQPPLPFVLSRSDRADRVFSPTPGKIEFRDGRLSVQRAAADATFDGTPLTP